MMVLLYDTVFCAGSLSKALRERAALYGGLAASWVALAVLLASNGRSHSAGFASGVSAWTYLLNQGPIVLRYLRLALWPTALVFDYGLPKAATLSSALPAALPILVLAAATCALWFLNRQIAFLCTWVFVTLAPTSTIIPIATEVGAERRMYLPMVAIAVLAVVAVARVASAAKAGRHVQVFVGSLVAASVTLGALTFARNADYHDPNALWRQVIARYPQGRAHYNLGVNLRDAGQRSEAIREFELSVNDMPDSEYALGFEALNDGRYEEAIARLRRYLQLKPLDINAVRASNLLGRSLLLAGRPDEAARAFRETLRMQRDNVDGTSGLGQALLDGGHLDEALTALREYAQHVPQSAPAHFNLGLTLLKLRRFEEAASELSRAATLNPRDAAAHANLGTTLVELGRNDEAVDQFRQAATVESDPSARAELQDIIQQLDAEKKGRVIADPPLLFADLSGPHDSRYQRTVADTPMIRPFRMPDGWLKVLGCTTPATTGGALYDVWRCRMTGFALNTLNISSVGATLTRPMPNGLRDLEVELIHAIRVLTFRVVRNQADGQVGRLVGAADRASDHALVRRPRRHAVRARRAVRLRDAVDTSDTSWPLLSTQEVPPVVTASVVAIGSG